MWASSTVIAASLIVLSVAALVLTVLVFERYRRERQLCHLYWAAGLFLFFVTLVEEAVLDLGVWSQPLIQSYFILVAVLVGILSLGSAELSLPGRWRTAYLYYIGLTSGALVVLGFLVPIPSSVMSNGVVSGLPPTSINVLSSLIAYPAAVLLIVSSVYGAVKRHRPNLLYIAAGTLVISAAGTLYLAQLPAILYYAEFVGIVLLFLGFVKIPHLTGESVREPRPT